MQSKNKSKKKINHKRNSSAMNDSTKKELQGESNSFKKIISRFLTNLCEKNYAQANKDLENAVEEKTKGKIKKAAKNVQNNKVAEGQSDSAKKASYAKKGSYDKKNSENVSNKR
jgi:hypothetical protein